MMLRLMRCSAGFLESGAAMAAFDYAGFGKMVEITTYGGLGNLSRRGQFTHRQHPLAADEVKDQFAPLNWYDVRLQIIYPSLKGSLLLLTSYQIQSQKVNIKKKRSTTVHYRHDKPPTEVAANRFLGLSIVRHK